VAAKGNAKKAWRFIGEMEEIAATYAAAGLPDSFHQGAAEIYRRMAIYKDGPTPSFAEVLRALTRAGRPEPAPPAPRAFAASPA
jgi:hypothetical protein